MRHHLVLFIDSEDDEDTVVQAVETALDQAGIGLDELCVVDDS